MMHDATLVTIVTFTNVLDWIGKFRYYRVTLGGLLSIFPFCETPFLPPLQQSLHPRPLKIELETRGQCPFFDAQSWPTSKGKAFFSHLDKNCSTKTPFAESGTAYLELTNRVSYVFKFLLFVTFAVV